MGKIDTVSKQYFGKPENFADAFNFLLYDGEPVIQASRLTELDPTEIAIPYKGKDLREIQKQRDLLMGMTDGDAIYVILGAELQSEVHNAMPVKNGLYDFMDYASQVSQIANEHQKEKDLETGAEYLSGFKRSDRIIPVITAVIYTGTEPWDGPLSLHDMMEFKNDALRAATPDYKIHLISPADIDDSDFSKFSIVDFGFAMKLLKHRDTDGDRVIEETNHKLIDPDTVNFLKVAANLDLDLEIEEGGVDMCKALERRYKEKEENGAKLMNYLWKNGRAADAERAERDRDFFDKLLTELLPVISPQAIAK